MTTPEGQLIGASIILHDETERKRLHKEIQHLRLKLEQRARELI